MSDRYSDRPGVGIAIAGASGRMGRLLVEYVLTANDVRLAGALEHAHSPEIGTDVGDASDRSDPGGRPTRDMVASLRSETAT